MAELFRSPLSQIANAGGVPVSGAKLYFYSAQTTDDLVVYQNVTLSTPHAQPVVADASGIFPAIYLGTSTYKAVLKDANDVTIKSFDNINTTASSNTVSDSVFRVQAAADATKQASFAASGITAGQTRVFTFPDASGTLALTSDIAAQTDNVFRIKNSSDATKKIGFDASAITTGNTRTLTAQDADGIIALLNLEGQTIAGGARVTVKDLGALSAAGSNTITPDPGSRPHQRITNDHAGSILPGSNNGDYVLDIINASGAGALTTTGWTLKGDSFDTTTTSKFRCFCSVTADAKTMHISKVA